MNIGVLGLGTVGGGLINLLKDNSNHIRRRIGREIVIKQVSVRDLSKKRICDTQDLELVTDPYTVVNNSDIDLVVELIGGTTLAKELVEQAINNKKHIVTANKALIATHGNELIKLAVKNNVQLLFEASVAGGIPIINTLKDNIISNQIDWLVGIINGTSNFILTQMKDNGRDFGDILKEAQELGYAEADPTFDIEGIDAAHKLSILSAIAFGTKIDFDRVWTEGISKLEPLDVSIAMELGYSIKHLGIAKKYNNKIELRVHPTLIPKDRLLANVDSVMNAVVIKGNALGPTLYYGAGAGDGPTASAVMSDIMNIAKGVDNNLSGWNELVDNDYIPIDDIISSHYLRLKLTDKAGVLANITNVLASFDVSVEALIQKEPNDKEDAIVAIVTNECKYNTIIEVMEQIQKNDFVHLEITHILIETLS